MKCICPKCGHHFDQSAVNQVKGGKERWKGFSAQQRREAAQKAALARWKK